MVSGRNNVDKDLGGEPIGNRRHRVGVRCVSSLGVFASRREASYIVSYNAAVFFPVGPRGTASTAGGELSKLPPRLGWS